MEIKLVEINDLKLAVVIGNEKIILDVKSALDFIMTVQYKTGSRHIAVNKEVVSDEFFILSTTLAGEILQKFINYHIKFAIIGDFSEYTSKPLKDFIYECNKGKDIFFVKSEEEAIKKLISV